MWWTWNIYTTNSNDRIADSSLFLYAYDIVLRAKYAYKAFLYHLIGSSVCKGPRGVARLGYSLGWPYTPMSYISHIHSVPSLSLSSLCALVAHGLRLVLAVRQLVCPFVEVLQAPKVGLRGCVSNPSSLREVLCRVRT